MMILQEDTDTNSYSLFSAPKQNDTKYQTPIIDYNQYPEARENADLRNANGDTIQKQIEESNGIKPPEQIKEGFMESIRNAMPNNPLDVNGDGLVNSDDAIVLKEMAVSKVKAVGSQASKTIQSGIVGGLEGAKKVALAVGDVNGDGVIDTADLGEAVRATGHNVREATGINALFEGAKDTGDKATSQMIMMGGAVILLYLLIKT